MHQGVSDDGFPADKLQGVMARRGKSLLFSEEEITELVEMEYGDKRVGSNYSAEPQHAIMAGFADEW